MAGRFIAGVNPDIELQPGEVVPRQRWSPLPTRRHPLGLTWLVNPTKCFGARKEGGEGESSRLTVALFTTCSAIGKRWRTSPPAPNSRLAPTPWSGMSTPLRSSRRCPLASCLWLCWPLPPLPPFYPQCADPPGFNDCPQGGTEKVVRILKAVKPGAVRWSTVTTPRRAGQMRNHSRTARTCSI